LIKQSKQKLFSQNSDALKFLHIFGETCFSKKND
jgi:hypothetical protein